jgi:hypothetical protein
MHRIYIESDTDTNKKTYYRIRFYDGGHSSLSIKSAYFLYAGDYWTEINYEYTKKILFLKAIEIKHQQVKRIPKELFVILIKYEIDD